MWSGSCHCGAVRFRVDFPISELTTCDCSLCARRNALMAKVPETLNVFCLDGFDVSSVPVRATEGAGMSIEDPAARAEWPGPRTA